MKPTPPTRAENNVPERLADLQHRFAAHIRDPQHSALPEGVEDRRMGIYRDLFFNNLRSMLGANFPVLHKVLGAERWGSIIRDFMIRHRAHTPLFPELPREFLQYLQDVRGPREDDPPFLLELAHYEWAELAVALDPVDINAIAVNPTGDLLSGVPVLSPVAWQLSYHYPVQHIRPDFQPKQPGDQPSHLLIYRRRDDQVGFMQLQPVSARLFHLLKENPDADGLSVLHLIAAELKLSDPTPVVDQGRQQLEQWRERDIILGTRA